MWKTYKDKIDYDVENEKQNFVIGEKNLNDFLWQDYIVEILLDDFYSNYNK